MNPDPKLDDSHKYEAPRESILAEKLPHRYGNRSRRRKLQAEVRKLMKTSA